MCYVKIIDEVDDSLILFVFSQDESDKLPFPNNEEEFSLPQDTFATLLKDRLQPGTTPDDEEELRSRTKHSVKKEELKEEGTMNRKGKPHKNLTLIFLISN